MFLVLFVAQFALVNLLALQSRFVRDSQYGLAAVNSLLLGVCGLVITPIIASADLLNQSPRLLLAYLAAGPLAVCLAIFTHDNKFATSRAVGSLSSLQRKTLMETQDAAQSLTPIELSIAEMILDQLEIGEFKKDDPFVWSDVFTAAEIELGVTRLIPDWFVEEQPSQETHRALILSDRFMKQFCPEPRFVDGARVVNFAGRIIPHAIILETARITAPARLLSLDGENECVITAIGKRHAFGYWLRLVDKSKTTGNSEEQLMLQNHNWRVVEASC